ncbi:MAG: NAD(P)H-dependent oxidoreductase [Paludibacteraceae bacterium]|nr:NAD(P)H-dependent oxidoreductase [Paludibacteraceae bacterium]
MKKIFFYSLLALCFTTACNAQNGKRNSMKQKTLIAYFSATGTTKAAAQRLASEHNAILWEIEPAEPYTAADLDWRDANSRSSREMKDPEERPIIKQCTDIKPYDTIYVGFPIWWGICPRIINSWIDNNLEQLKSKTLVPFATSGSSGIEDAVAYLRKTYPELKWEKGKLMNN